MLGGTAHYEACSSAVLVPQLLAGALRLRQAAGAKLQILGRHAVQAGFYGMDASILRKITEC